MRKLIQIAPPHSLFFFGAGVVREPPEIEKRPISIWSTRACIVVGSLCFMDGETDLMISDPANDALLTAPTFQGVLDTPNRTFVVSTSEHDILFRTDVPGHFTRVRIWTDDPREPEHILVVLG